MKNLKKFISAVTAFAMMATMFAGLGISANAEDISIPSSESVYVDRANPDTNFNGADQESLKSLYTQFRNWTPSTAIGTMNFRNENASMPIWKFDISGIPADANIAEADVTLTVVSTGDNKAANEMSIVGYNGEWDASTITYNTMENVGGSDITTYLTGTVDGLGSFQPLNTTDVLATSTPYPQTITASLVDYLESAIAAGKDYISIAVAEDSTRIVNFSTEAKLDVVTTTEALYDVTMTTAPLATVTVNDTAYYSDKDGNVNLGAYTEGTVLNYSVTKSGYTSLEDQTATVGTDDLNIDAPISPADENVLYYEDYTSSGVADRATSLMGIQRYFEGKLQVWGADTVALKGVEGGSLYTVSIADYETYVQNPGNRERTKTIAFMDGSTTLFTITANIPGNGVASATLSTGVETMDIPTSGDISLTVGNGKLVGTIGDAAINMSAAETVSKIDAIAFSGNADVYLTLAIGTIKITSPDPDYLAVSGPAKIAKIAGVDRTAEYDYIVSYVDPSETFTWDVSGVDGVTINQDGVLTVADTAAQGTAVISIESSTGKSATFNVEIGDFATVSSYQIETSKALNLGEKTTISVYNVIDENGADITDYITLSDFISTNDDVVSVDGSGNVTSVGNGTAKVNFNIETGKDNAASVDYTVAKFYVTADATGNTTVVDLTGIVLNDNITGYKVTTADAEGNLVKEYIAELSDVASVVEENAVTITAVYNSDGTLQSAELGSVQAGSAAPSVEGATVYLWNSIDNMKPVNVVSGLTVDTTGAAKVEVSPVFTYTYEAEDFDGAGHQLNGVFADGLYNFEVTKTYTNRADIYVNGYMIGNNVDQDGTGRAMGDSDRVYNVSDIVVAGGSITVSTTDYSGGSSGPNGKYLDKIVVEKAASIVNRTQKVYVVGDSLVAEYYGEPSVLVGSSRSGWGQMLENFFTDDVEVINFANSGDYASRILTTSYPGVLHSAQQGDYLIIESGYNDANSKNNTTEEQFKDYIQQMIDGCKAKGIIPILVSPNASSHTWGAGIVYAPQMREVAAANPDVLFIDLTQKSYDYLNTLYSGNRDTIDKNFNLETIGGGDRLHSSYLGAMKWAEIVAQGMYDAGIDFIDTSFTWSIEDGEGNTITVQIK